MLILKLIRQIVNLKFILVARISQWKEEVEGEKHESILKKADKEIKYEKVKMLTKDTFSDFIKENPSTFIEFYSPGCGHCIKFAPAYEELATELEKEASEFKIAAVNCAEEETICEENKI